MRRRRKLFIIVLFIILFTNVGFCTNEEYPQLQRLGTFVNTHYLADYFYDAAHDELYIVELEKDYKTSHGYVVHLDGSPVTNPAYPFTDNRRIFMAFDGNQAAAIETGKNPDGTYVTYLNDFSGELVELPSSWWISNFKIRNGRFGFIASDNYSKTKLYDLTKEELLNGSLHPAPLDNNINSGFDYSMDGTRIYLNTSRSDWPFREITEFDAVTYEPIQIYTLTYQYLACVRDIICTQNSFVTESVIQHVFGGIVLQHYDANWELTVTNEFPWRQTPLTLGPEGSTITISNRDGLDKLPYYKISKIIWEEPNLNDSHRSGDHRFHPLITEENRVNCTKAHYIDGGFGLFHPSANDPDDENARDRSIILAPLRSTQSKATLDIPYCDVQNAFSIEATTLLIQWNDAKLSIPLDSLNCNEILDQASCKTKATLRLHLSIKEGKIQLEQKELLATESLDDCNSLIHHTVLP